MIGLHREKITQLLLGKHIERFAFQFQLFQLKLSVSKIANPLLIMYN